MAVSPAGLRVAVDAEAVDGLEAEGEVDVGIRAAAAARLQRQPGLILPVPRLPHPVASPNGCSAHLPHLKRGSKNG